MNELWEALLEFCAKENIEVNQMEQASVAGFIATSTPIAPWKVTLYRSKDQEQEELIYHLAHEVGHVMDAKQTGYLFRYELAKMLMADGEQLDQSLRVTILEREQAATDIGRKLLIELGLEDLTSYDEDAQANMDFYVKKFESIVKHVEILEKLS